MGINGASNGSNSNNNSNQILSGNTILDKLLNQLPPDDRELLLRLIAELGVPLNDPMFPFLVVLQYYVATLRDIPEAMKSSADESFRRAIMVYGTIQSNIDNSTAKIESEIGKVESARIQWNKDTQALLSEFRATFNTALSKAMKSADESLPRKTSAHQKKADEINKMALQSWTGELENTRKIYLRDVFTQGFIWAGSSTVIALLAVGGAAYWSGFQHGQEVAVQDSYKAFGGSASYTFAKNLMNRADNGGRFVKCGDEGNDKCTVWIKNPPQR